MAYKISEGLHLEQSRQQREFLELPVVPKTVLFVNVTTNSMSGDLRTLIAYCLGREDLADYTFYWDVQALADLAGIPDELIEADRVHVVAHDAYEYRRALATSEYIVAANLLPFQFVKRPGQHLVFLPLEGMYLAELTASRRFLQGLTPVLDAADLLVTADDLMLEFMLPHRSPACTQPLRTLTVPHPRGDLSHRSDEAPCKVVISISKRLFNKRWANKPDRLFEWTRRVASAWDVKPQEICLMVPGQAMDWVNDGYIHTPVKLVTYVEGLYAQLEGAQVLLTNNIYDLAIGLQRGVECVYARADSETYDDLVCFAPYDLPYHSVVTLSEAIELIRTLLPTLGEGSVHSSDEVSQASCKAIVDAMLDETLGEPYADQGNRDLLIVPWNEGSGFRAFQHRGLNRSAGTLLLMGDEKFRILKDERIHYAGACLTYRAGFHSGDDEERKLILQGKDDELYELIKDNPTNFMVLEWQRMLGNVHFDRILAPAEGLNCFWRVLLRFAPADKVEYYESLEALDA